MSSDFDPSLGLLRELGHSTLSEEARKKVTQLLDVYTQLNSAEIARVGLDIAVTFGMANDWLRAREILKRYRHENPSDSGALVFEMRCLFELENFSEVLALGQSQLSERPHLLTANYLMGLSFEALGMPTQARNRYESILKMDPQFLDTPLRLIKLQGGPTS